MSLNESIAKIRVALQESDIKKTGKNNSSGFSYFELSDFLPTLNKLMLDEGINDIIDIGTETPDNEQMYASLTLIKGDEQQIYRIPFRWFSVPVSSKGNQMMQEIQYLGAINTYLKRYLYLNAFGITDGDVIDSMPKQESQQQAPGLPKYMTTTEELEKAKKELSDLCKVYNIDKKAVVAAFGVNSSTTLAEYKSIVKQLIDDNSNAAEQLGMMDGE